MHCLKKAECCLCVKGVCCQILPEKAAFDDRGWKVNCSMRKEICSPAQAHTLWLTASAWTARWGQALLYTLKGSLEDLRNSRNRVSVPARVFAWLSIYRL